MAIKNIKKINVRSPYYVNVGNAYEIPVVDDDIVVPDPDPVDEIIPPDPDPPTEPSVPIYDIGCGINYSMGGAVGVHKFRHKMKGRQFGEFTYTVDEVKVPMKMRIYNEGAAPSDFYTVGRDEYASLWFDATGESPTTLTPKSNGEYPVISKSLTYDYTQVDADTYGTNLIIELQLPLRSLGFKHTLSCQDMVGIESPAASGYVNVLTIEHRIPATLSQFTVSIDGVNYDLSTNTSIGDGIRFIYDDQTPLIAPESNLFPYPQTGNLYRKAHETWSYSGMTLTHLSHLDFGQLNTQISVIAPRGVGDLNLTFRMAKRPISVINGVRTLLPSELGNTAHIYFTHSDYSDSSSAVFTFDSIQLRAMGTVTLKRNGEEYISRVSSLTNQQ